MTAPADSPLATKLVRCQCCNSGFPEPLLSLGDFPLVNDFRDPEIPLENEPRFPLRWFHCPDCHLVQIDCAVSRHLVFPPGYPYTSGATRAKRESFEEMFRECSTLIDFAPGDLILDIGSNDGSLLSPFGQAGHRVFGVEPTDVADLATARNIPTVKEFLDGTLASRIESEHGRARIVAATNILAHVDNVSEILDAAVSLLDDSGMLVCEIQYLFAVIDTLSIDSIYHEHLRYYTLRTLENHLGRHGLQVFHARHLATHGGLLRVYAARPGDFAIESSVEALRDWEDARGPMDRQLGLFAEKAETARQDLTAILDDAKGAGKRIFGIGAAPRGAALMAFAGIDESIVECVLEVPGSLKIGKCVPGTRIPVKEEALLFDQQPEIALFFAWHLAEALAPKFWADGFTGDFVVPLPKPRILRRDF